MQIDRYIWIIISIYLFFFFPEANIRRPFRYLNTIEIQYINLLPNSVSPFRHYRYQSSLCITNYGFDGTMKIETGSQQHYTKWQKSHRNKLQKLWFDSTGQCA